MSMSRLVSEGFELRRAWRDRTTDTAEKDFGPADIMILGLILKVAGRKAVLCEDPRLAAALTAAFHDAPSFRDVSVATQDVSVATEAADDDASLILARTSSLASGGKGLRLVFDAGSILPLDRFKAVEPGLHLMPFSVRSPALWQSRLAWCVHESLVAPCESITTQIVTLLNDAWLDPLALFDRVKTLEQTARRLEKGGDAQGDGQVETITDLKARIALLENTGLIRHEILVAKAAQSRKLAR